MVVTVEAEEWRLRLEPFEQVLFLLCWRNSMRMVEFFILDLVCSEWTTRVLFEWLHYSRVRTYSDVPWRRLERI